MPTCVKDGLVLDNASCEYSFVRHVALLSRFRRIQPFVAVVTVAMSKGLGFGAWIQLRCHFMKRIHVQIWEGEGKG